MADLSGFPVAEVQFDRDGGLVGGGDAVLALAADRGTTDLLVLSHGWNNDQEEARQLYRNLAASLRAVLDSGVVGGLAERRIAIAAVLWPSKRFSESDLARGGAAAAASPLDAEAVLDQVQALRALFPEPAAQQTLDLVSALVPSLPDRATSRAGFAEALRSLLAPDAAGADDASTNLFAVSGRALMDRLAVPVSLAPPTRRSGPAAALGPGAVGGAAGLGSLLGGVWGAARNLLNYVTYYEMKARAGTIGEQGLAPLVARVHQGRPELRIHLLGHSFGGRLVAAVAKALPAPDVLATLTLLQAAFSHYGFADDWGNGQPGYFRGVVTDRKVSGPILVTDTVNDVAVGLAYAIASRIAGQVAAAVGDAEDVYGGIGRNGAQKTPEALPATLLDVGGDYTWQPRVLHNLLADEFITSHSDVTGHQVGYALLSALSTTGT